MGKNDIRDLIYDAIQDGCINENHEELKYAIHFSLIGPDPSTHKTEIRLYIDDVRGWESVFFDEQIDVDTPGFYFDIQDAVHLLIKDYLALPHDKNGGFRYATHQETTDIRDYSEDAVDAMCYFIQNGRANGKTLAFKDLKYSRKNLENVFSNFGIEQAQRIIFDNKKGKPTMAMTEGIKITTERYMSESEARYDSELKNIETKLQQDISNAQFEAQKARCELENWFRAERIKEQESDKALKRKAYYDGLIASGFTEDQALKILLEDL